MDKTERLLPFWDKGLSNEDVLTQQKRGKKNISPEKITKTNKQIIKDNLFTLFNFYNFFIAFSLAFVGAYANMLFILVILTNITIGIAQEIHARNLVEELSLVTTPKIIVVRESNEKEILVEDLVEDDIVIFDSGKQISIDAVVVKGMAELNESLLTGEADTIVKKEGDLLLSGSFVVSGKCYAKVENVGVNSYANKIAIEAKQHKKVKSELLESMQKVVRISSFLIIPLGALLFIEAYVFRKDPVDISVIYTAAGILGMLPKGLVLLMSIALAAGIIALSRKKVLVQELFALETLAHVDMLCLDKTGTITEGKMSVSSVFKLEANDKLEQSFDQMISSLLAASDDNNATYIALKEFFPVKGKINCMSKIPFSSERKWSAVNFEEGFSLVLGAPDRLSNVKMPEEILQEERLGARILLAALSYEEIKSAQLSTIIPLAYIIIQDPVRINAAQTLDFFKKEGVQIKIISGDNPVTVSAIANIAGVEDYTNYIDMSTCTTNEDIAKAARECTIFGRVTPAQKKELIKSLKDAGHTVAMTGDGVNDVLALREADCGIAMAEGSDAARQVSKLVLLNSDFASLLDVLYEGRRVVNNITRVSGIFFVKTFYSVMLAVLCIIVNIPFPLIPLQVAVIDIIIEGYPSFFMSFEEDKKRIHGKYLHTVFRKAFPNALTTVIAILLIYFWANTYGVEKGDYITAMYGIIGFVGIMAVIKASMPLNKLRLFLATSTLIGFFVCMIIFNDVLQLSILAGDILYIFMSTAFLCVVIERIIAFSINKIMLNKKTSV